MLEMSERNFNRMATEADELQKVWRIARRRYRFALLVTAVVVLAGVAWTIVAIPVYQASATVMIEDAKPALIEGVSDVFQPNAGGYWGIQKYMETQYHIMESEPVLQGAARRLGLDAAGMNRLLNENPDSLPAELAVRLQILGLKVGTPRRELIPQLSDRRSGQAMAKGLIIKPLPETRLVKIIVQRAERAWAGRIANAIAESYEAYNYELRVQSTRESNVWLTEQVDQLRKKYEASELAVSDFKKASNSFALSLEDTRNVTTQMISELSSELTKIKASRIRQQSIMERINATTEKRDLVAAFKEALSSPLLQSMRIRLGDLQLEDTKLSGRYTPEHPKRATLRESIEEVEKAIHQELWRKTEALRNEVAALKNSETNLTREIESLKGQALALNEKGISLNRLAREQKQNADLYDMVVKRQKEVELVEALETNNVRVFERFGGIAPQIQPRPVFNLALSLVAGVVLALIVVMIVENLDHRIRDLGQIEELSSAPVMGVLPTINESGDEPKPRDRFALMHPKSTLAEALRSLRTNLTFLLPEPRRGLFLVTSSQPKEGKSTLVCNLGAIFALSEQRTLVVDTDMRRPRLHKTFEVNSRHGISSILAGMSSVEESIQSTGFENLDVLPCGPIPPNPAELIEGAALECLLDELRGRYDRIILDSPPLNAVTDALLLSPHSDGMILVAKQGQTSAHALKEALRKIAAVEGKLTGIVLNDVVQEKNSYSTYYGQYYQHYGEDDPATA